MHITGICMNSMMQRTSYYRNLLISMVLIGVNFIKVLGINGVAAMGLVNHEFSCSSLLHGKKIFFLKTTITKTTIVCHICNGSVLELYCCILNILKKNMVFEYRINSNQNIDGKWTAYLEMNL